MQQKELDKQSEALTKKLKALEDLSMGVGLASKSKEQKSSPAIGEVINPLNNPNLKIMPSVLLNKVPPKELILCFENIIESHWHEGCTLKIKIGMDIPALKYNVDYTFKQDVMIYKDYLQEYFSSLGYSFKFSIGYVYPYIQQNPYTLVTIKSIDDIREEKAREEAAKPAKLPDFWTTPIKIARVIAESVGWISMVAAFLQMII